MTLLLSAGFVLLAAQTNTVTSDVETRQERYQCRQIMMPSLRCVGEFQLSVPRPSFYFDVTRTGRVQTEWQLGSEPWLNEGSVRVLDSRYDIRLWATVTPGGDLVSDTDETTEPVRLREIYRFETHVVDDQVQRETLSVPLGRDDWRRLITADMRWVDDRIEEIRLSIHALETTLTYRLEGIFDEQGQVRRLNVLDAGGALIKFARVGDAAGRWRYFNAFGVTLERELYHRIRPVTRALFRFSAPPFGLGGQDHPLVPDPSAPPAPRPMPASTSDATAGAAVADS